MEYINEVNIGGIYTLFKRKDFGRYYCPTFDMFLTEEQIDGTNKVLDTKKIGFLTHTLCCVVIFKIKYPQYKDYSFNMNKMQFETILGNERIEDVSHDFDIFYDCFILTTTIPDAITLMVLESLGEVINEL